MNALARRIQRTYLALMLGNTLAGSFINDMIPSQQRATVLSFDSLLGSSDGVVLQPALGRTADVYGYPLSFLLAGAFAFVAVPFLVASRREHSPADRARRPLASP